MSGGGTVTPIASATGPTDAEVLAALKLAIYNNAVAGGPLSYNIGGTRVEFNSRADMVAEYKFWQDQVATEDRGGAVVLGGLSGTP